VSKANWRAAIETLLAIVRKEREITWRGACVYDGNRPTETVADDADPACIAELAEYDAAIAAGEAALAEYDPPETSARLHGHPAETTSRARTRGDR
jgi:hypothetical protein